MVVFSPARASRPRLRAAACARRASLPSGAAHAGDDLARHRIDDVADGVDRDDGGDDESVRQRDRRRPDAGLHRSAAGRRDAADLPMVAPAPAPTLPSCTGASLARLGRPVAAVGRRDGSSDCRRTRDRTGSPPARSARRRRRRPDSRCCARRAIHHAGRGVETEGAAARQRDGVDDLHRVHRVQQIGLARARRAAAHVDAAGGAVLGEDRRCTPWDAR